MCFRILEKIGLEEFCNFTRPIWGIGIKLIKWWIVRILKMIANIFSLAISYTSMYSMLILLTSTVLAFLNRNS